MKPAPLLHPEHDGTAASAIPYNEITNEANESHPSAPGMPAAPKAAAPELAQIDEAAWAEARRRFALIAPMLEAVPCPRSVVAQIAQSGGVDTTTLYRWARIYRASGLLTSLLPAKPQGGRGKSRLTSAVEQILTQTINDYYLAKQQRTIRSTALEVARRCREAKLSPPDVNTVRLRIRALPMREQLARRSHAKEAADRFIARPGTFDEAQKPLDIVQIDHTKLDIIVVDEQQVVAGWPEDGIVCIA